MDKVPLIFYLVHGIRTREKEILSNVSKFKRLVNSQFAGTQFEPIIVDGSYGWVGLFSNLLPPLRRLLIRKIGSEIKNLNKQYPNGEIAIISYSFGTFLTSEMLQKYDVNVRIWVLFGGVVHCRYNFQKTKNVTHVLNFCSTEDEVAKYAPILFKYGHSGCYGFRINNGVDKAQSSLDGNEIAWNGFRIGEKFRVINCHRNSVEHSGNNGWFANSNYILEMFWLIKSYLFNWLHRKEENKLTYATKK